MYVFLSMSNLQTGKNIGCCIVKANTEEQAIKQVEKLHLIPETCDNIKMFQLDEKEFKAQNMDLDTFYSRDEMKQKGFQSESVQIVV